MHRFRWLNEHDDTVWNTIWEFVSRMPVYIDSHLKEHEDMALIEYLTVLKIARAENHTVIMSELARRTGTSPSRLSHVMDRLEQRGLTERSRSAQDRRSTYASLTPEGVEFIVRTTPDLIDMLRDTVFEPVTEEELDQLTAIIQKILTRL